MIKITFKRMEITMNFKEEKNITIFEHPLIKHKISLLRDKYSGSNVFR